MFRDHHVHLGLVDPATLPASGIGGVVDLGWSPEVATLRAPVEVVYAGRFLAAPGGYPSDRSWAPAGCIRFVGSPEEAAAAVAEQASLGAALVKVTLNAEAGPVPSGDTVAAVGAAAAVPVVAHAQGDGMVELALAAGIPVLAHTPWTSVLADDVVREAAARQVWISTLDIHGYGEATSDRDIALANLRRFWAAGGRVLYGTDLGNGPLPVGLNLREVALVREAGLPDVAVLDALTDPWPSCRPTPGTGSGARVTFVPGDPPSSTARVTTSDGSRGSRRAGELEAWLAAAVVVPEEELEEE